MAPHIFGETEYEIEQKRLVTPDDRPIAECHQRWASIGDSYYIEVVKPDFDPFLILSCAIAFDFAPH